MYDIGDYVIHKESGEYVKIISKSKSSIPEHYTIQFGNNKTLFICQEDIKKDNDT